MQVSVQGHVWIVPDDKLAELCSALDSVGERHRRNSLGAAPPVPEPDAEEVNDGGTD